MELFLEPLRAITTPIDRILECFRQLVVAIFNWGYGGGYMDTLIKLILNNEYLLISVSVLIIGFVIAIIKRLISV